MLKVLTEAKDSVILGFALKRSEVERLKPEKLRLQTRTHDNDEHGFMVLGLVHFTEFYAENFPLLSFDFPGAYLAICIEGPHGEPAYYVKRLFAPRLQSTLFRWLGGFPSRSMNLEFPTKARPGGEYRWSIEGDGAGVLMGKINQKRSVAGRLADFFGSSEKMIEFFWKRDALYAGSPQNLNRMSLDVSKPDYHPIVFDKMELGFLASDLERHDFPEAVLGNFFVPDISMTLEGPTSESLV